jgi:hypothetical protein
VPAPRRKTQPPALFTQVLEGMNGPTPPHPAAVEEAVDDGPVIIAVAPLETPPATTAMTSELKAAEPVEPAEPAEPDEPADGGFRRSLIRATFPRPEGAAPPPRSTPEFTIQSLNNRRNGGGQRHAGAQNKFRGGRRRPAGGGSQDHLGPMRFRDHGSQTNNNGQGGGQGQGQGQGGGRRRRGGKKTR